MINIIARRPIENVLGKELKDYSLYVVRTRALPNIMDGMRVGARKILYAAIKNKRINPQDKTKIGVNPLIKVDKLIGDAMDLEWGHGDASLKNTIEQLAKVHHNEFNPLYIDGQIGTLQEPTIKTASRYLMVSRTKYLKLFEDSAKLWNLKIEDGVEVEPEYFYPILPVTLMYRTSAPGFGFSFSCFSYDVNDIINNVLTVLTHGSCSGLNWNMINPKVVGIKDENIIYNYNTDTYYNVGEYKLLTKSSIRITSLPYNWPDEKYEKYLEKLVDKGTIKSWKNLTKGTNINFEITFPPGMMIELINKKLKFFQLLKLYSKIPKDILNLIDNDGETIINFSNIRHLIEAFVERRLKVFEEYRLFKINELESKIAELNNKIGFIQLIIDEKIEIRRKSKENILYQCSQKGYNFTDTIDDLLKLPIKRLTQEEIDKANNLLNGLKSELKYYKDSTNTEMYIKSLYEFKKEFCEIKKVEVC